MSAEQRNDLCSICHGHIKPITNTYKPGDRLFDHFDLATLEINAFYPDGRGKGETFTLTQWLMNPCAESAKMDCMHCHTSSGRYRFKDPEKANNACLPCHADRVKNAAAHTHHKEGSPGNQCISCHMTPTYYDRMKQSDHSMLPPTPAATIAFGSPNACNYCHYDKDPAWADGQVRSWHSGDYQAPLLKRAGLIEEAKKGDWRNLPEMLQYIQSKDRNQVVAATLIRLMFMNRDERILPALLAASKDPSPLVRSAAVQALGYRHSPDADAALMQAAGDDYRVVRISAACGLATPRFEKIRDNNDKAVNKAIDEFLASLMLHPDLWTSYDITGNVYQRLSRFAEAESAYKTALRINPRAVGTMLNLATEHKKRGDISKAENILRQAVKTEPAHAGANLSLGLLKYEGKDFTEAEKYLRNAFKVDPRMDAAAYTLAVITSKNNLAEAITWCKTAVDLSPKNPLYAYTLALYQDRAGDQKTAIKVLEELIAGNSGYGNAYLLLGDIYTKIGKREEARHLYSQALAAEDISAVFQDRIKAKLDAVR
jgi:tetratricopeptide (TPR) repeat protein